MSELITAIALICQINGGGDQASWRHVQEIKKEQIACQKQMATCILEMIKLPNSNYLKCLQERK